MKARGRHPIGWVLAAALGLRLALGAGGWAHPERLLTEEDSAEYLQIARNLADGNGFSQSTQPPYDADVRRTPVYPAVLAAVFTVPGAGVRAAALAGVLVSALTVLVTFRLAGGLGGTATAWWAGLLLALDLTSAAYATQVLTEPLFTLLLVMSFLPLLESGGGVLPGAIAAGTLSGLAALCRPIGLFAFATLAPACRMRAPRLGGAVRLLAIASVMAGVLAAGWMARNYRAAGTATVSSVVATNMYFHRGAYVEAWLQDRRVEDLRDEWQRDFRARSAAWSEDERVLWMNEHGRGLILEHPFVYGVVALRGAARMLAPDHIVLSSLAGGTGTAAFRVVRAMGWVQLAIVYALATIGLARLARVSWLRAAVPLAPVAYFLAIGGPEMYPRFRVPLMPFVSVLAACGITMGDRA